MRNNELKEKTLKMLGRLNAPRAVQNNDENMKSEADFLCNQIIKLAPSKNYIEWFQDFEQNILSNLETRTWPTAKEISKSAKAKTRSSRCPMNLFYFDDNALRHDYLWKFWHSDVTLTGLTCPS